MSIGKWHVKLKHTRCNYCGKPLIAGRSNKMIWHNGPKGRLTVLNSLMDVFEFFFYYY